MNLFHEHFYLVIDTHMHVNIDLYDCIVEMNDPGTHKHMVIPIIPIYFYNS